MTLAIALIIAVLLLAAIIALIVKLLSPAQPDSVFRTRHIDSMNGQAIQVVIEREGKMVRMLGTAHRDDFDFLSQLRDLDAEADALAEDYNRSEQDRKQLTMEVG
jgi:hypothetical protein